MKDILRLMLAGFALQCAQAQPWLTNGLVAFYPFNGNANDESGNGRHGQVVGSVALSADRFGTAGRAYRFVHESYGSINVFSPVLNLGQPQYTISGWFCSDDVTRLYQNLVNTIPHQGLMLELNSEVTPGAFMFSTGTGASWTDLYMTGATTNFTDQTWYQVVLTKTGTNYTVYLNGKIDGQYRVSAAAGYNYDVGFRFGTINTGQWNWQGFHGRLDDFRIYNRALSAHEVAQLYAIEFAPAASFVKAFTVDFSNLVVGSNYQVQASSDLANWTNWGASFTAASTTYTNSSYERIDNWNRLYFRIEKR